MLCAHFLFSSETNEKEPKSLQLSLSLLSSGRESIQSFAVGNMKSDINHATIWNIWNYIHLTRQNWKECCVGSNIAALRKPRTQNKIRHQTSECCEVWDSHSMTINIAVFCDVPLCSLVGRYRRYGWTCYLLYPEDGASSFLRNIDNDLLD
jgi:hypothetical protein